MSNNGTIAVVAQSKGFGSKPLVVMVVIAQGKIAGWSLVDEGSNNLFSQYNNANPHAYVGESIMSVIAAQNISGVTMSGDALCNIINIAAYYVRSILQ